MKNLIKLLYKIFPFKAQIFSILKSFYVPPKSVYQHLYFKGIIVIKIDNKRKFRIHHYGFQLENEIFWTGLTKGWEKESMKLWIKLSEISNNIVDIGSNTGIYALVAKATNPESKVIAFEPVPKIFEKLCHNIELNSYDIIPVEKAASNYNGIATIYDTPTDHVYSVTVNKNLNTEGIAVIERKIPTIKLDTYIEDNEIGKIDLMKIDVETHEPEVLEGFQKFLPIFKPTLLIEILNNEIGRKIQELLKNLDYLYFNIDERGSVRQVHTITASDYYNYLICSNKIAKKIGLINSTTEKVH